jgi:hypothetical protein
MPSKFSISHRGADYEAEIRPVTPVNEDAAAASDAWHVVRQGRVVTTIPVEPGESESSVREKIIEWLDARPAFG